MKKLFGALTLLVGLAGICRAGTPQEVYYPGQFPLSNTTVQGSTTSTASNLNLSTVVAAVTSSNGGTTINCRTCLTNWSVYMPSTTVLSILDAGTTIYSMAGVALGSSGVNALSVNRDHLAPLCAASNDAMTFNLVNTNGVSTNTQGFNYEGYTSCGGSANKGPSQ